MEPGEDFYPLYVESKLLYGKYREHEQTLAPWLARIARIVGTTPKGNMEGEVRRHVRQPYEESMKTHVQRLSTSLGTEKANRIRTEGLIQEAHESETRAPRERLDCTRGSLGRPGHHSRQIRLHDSDHALDQGLGGTCGQGQDGG